MIRPNRSYSFVSANALQPKNVDFSNAQTLTDIDSILSGNERIGEYSVVEDETLDKRCHEIAEKVEIKIKTLNSGNDVNDSFIVKKDGKKVSIRLYGTEKKLHEPKVLDKNALKDLHFCKCMSDGKIVSNAGYDATGKPCLIPVIYLKLA